jgi:hypothetical protein
LVSSGWGGERLADALVLHGSDEATEHLAEPTLHARYNVPPAVRVEHSGADAFRFSAAERPPQMRKK